MNALVKKEIRLLLPSAAICCALGLANFLFVFNNDGSLQNAWGFVLSFVFCGGTAIMLALNSFGAEISSGTFSNLLVQPISRQKIWDTKILLLAATLLAVGIFWSACGLARLAMLGRNLGLLDLFTGVGIFGLVIFSGGLWTVLLLRQVAAAFWFTLIVPGGLLTIPALIGLEDQNFFSGVAVTVLGLYSLAGFFFARWLFFRAQDLQWSGGNIVMPELRGLARWKPAAGRLRQWRPRAALWRKEIMLHQSQLVMAFVLAVLHGGVLVARQFVDKYRTPDLYFVLQIFWGLWLVMPVLIGCAAVAEERKLGTHEGQLCLPVRRRTQFGIKLVTAMVLSLLLGLAVPLLFESTRILPPVYFGSGSLENTVSSGSQYFSIALSMLNSMLPLLTLALIVVGFCGVAFYVSTLSRNTLQSIAPTVFGIVVVWGLILLAVVPWDRMYRLHGLWWSGPLPYLIGGPLLVLALLVLMAGNFNQAQPTLKLAGKNLGVLLAAILLSAGATSAIYHRLWEKLTPFEPAHGPARLSAANPAQLTVWWAETSVRLPDGRIWTAPFAYDTRDASLVQRLLGNVKCKLGEGKLYPGSNWLSIRRYSRELVGIKTDGTLWISEAPIPIQKVRQSGWQADDKTMRNLQPFGTETDWANASPRYLSTLLVKTDGTLWRLGTNQFNTKKQAWPGLRAFIPSRLGTDSDWSKITWDYHQFVMIKTNGSIWISEGQYGCPTNQLKKLEIEPGFTMVELYDGAKGKFRSTTLISHGLLFKAGIREDGTFRIWADMHLNSKQRNRTYEFAPTDRQIGGGTNWIALAGGNEKVVTLKNDGTLWLWDFNYRSSRGVDELRLEREVEKTVPVQLGSHSDWIAISGEPNSLIALAADGSLWFWPLADANQYYDSSPANSQMQVRPLLDVSRKPQRLGNIFGKTE